MLGIHLKTISVYKIQGNILKHTLPFRNVNNIIWYHDLNWRGWLTNPKLIRCSAIVTRVGEAGAARQTAREVTGDKSQSVDILPDGSNAGHSCRVSAVQAFPVPETWWKHQRYGFHFWLCLISLLLTGFYWVSFKIQICRLKTCCFRTLNKSILLSSCLFKLLLCHKPTIISQLKTNVCTKQFMKH